MLSSNETNTKDCIVFGSNQDEGETVSQSRGGMKWPQSGFRRHEGMLFCMVSQIM